MCWVVIFRLVTIAALLIGGFIWFIKSEHCPSITQNSLISPSGKWKAEVYECNCDSLSETPTAVSIVGSREDRPDCTSDNYIFSVTGNHGKVSSENLYKNGGPKIVLRWLSDSKIEISYPQSSSLFKSDTKFKNIVLEYFPAR